jgi:hypothetical protein
MNALVLWAITAAVLIVCAGRVGKVANGKWTGILIDERDRYSLTHLQTVLWALMLLSLLAAIFLARLIAGLSLHSPLTPGDVLDIYIPSQILILAGISGGSAVLATAVKSQPDRTQRFRDQQGDAKPRFSQVFLVEEGANMDKAVDVMKFQNFFLTLIAVGAYVAMAASVLAGNTEWHQTRSLRWR